jgi:hypothetical protein
MIACGGGGGVGVAVGGGVGVLVGRGVAVGRGVFVGVVVGRGVDVPVGRTVGSTVGAAAVNTRPHAARTITVMSVKVINRSWCIPYLAFFSNIVSVPILPKTLQMSADVRSITGNGANVHGVCANFLAIRT